MPATIEYVSKHQKFQGEFITPTCGVVDCYNEDDFIEAAMTRGRQLIRQQLQDGVEIPTQSSSHAGFITWSHIRLWQNESSASQPTSQKNSNARTQWVLNQAFHPLWKAEGCKINRSASSNLVVDCSAARWRDGPIDRKFNNTLSTYAANVSMKAGRSGYP